MKQLLLLLLISISIIQASGMAEANDCRTLMRDFIQMANQEENLSMIKNNWKISEKKKFLNSAVKLGFNQNEIKIMIDGLNMQENETSPATVMKYLTYVLTLNDETKKVALLDIAQLENNKINSVHVSKFHVHEKKIEQIVKQKKMSTAEAHRYQELYYGCRALTPNVVNANAARDFKRFNLSLNLGSLGASYAFYNMDKELNAEWFAKLGYDVGVTLLFSHVGGKIQTNASDTQLVKSLKSYFMGRVLGLTDVIVYDPLFNDENERAEDRIKKLKNDPEMRDEVEKLLIQYENRGLYRQYKNELVENLKKIPGTLSLGIAGNSKDENNVDWNNLKSADLDRPEVQEVLVAAAMAQIYSESKGEWIETGDMGLDRYVFNTAFYAVQIPKSIAQNFITYRMLCMGQDSPKLSFTKAVLFNVSVNFIVNQGLFGYREKAINQ